MLAKRVKVINYPTQVQLVCHQFLLNLCFWMYGVLHRPLSERMIIMLILLTTSVNSLGSICCIINLKFSKNFMISNLW